MMRRRPVMFLPVRSSSTAYAGARSRATILKKMSPSGQPSIRAASMRGMDGRRDVASPAGLVFATARDAAERDACRAYLHAISS